MKALLGKEGYAEVLVTELGGRKRDRKKMVMDNLERSYQEGSLPQYQEGSVSVGSHDPTARVPGQDDVFDALSKAVLGGNEESFNLEGSKIFSNVPRGSMHHAIASEEASRRYGFLPSQAGGLAVEGVEHLMGANRSPQGREDTRADLVANVLGGLTGMLPAPYSKYGHRLTDYLMDSDAQNQPSLPGALRALLLEK